MYYLGVYDMSEKKVWLTERKIKQLEQFCNGERELSVIKLGAWCGMRANEIAKSSWSNMIERTVKSKNDSTYESESLQHFLKVAGKKTNQSKGNGEKKIREVFIPQNVYHTLELLKAKENINEAGPIVPTKRTLRYPTTATVRRWVREVAYRTQTETGDSEFADVSSHDLRRFFAHHHLVEKNVNPRVVMDVGGWENWKSIKPYLDKPSSQTIYDELSR